MSRQVIGAFVELLGATGAANGAPAGAAGIRLCDSFPGGQPASEDWLLRVEFTNATDQADLHVWGRDKDVTSPLWGTFSTGDGQVDGATLTGTNSLVKYLRLSDLGVLDRIYLEVKNVVGVGFSVRADLAPVYNNEPNGLVS